MGKYTTYQHHEERPWEIHPIWRGIGCLWLILLPIMSYAAAVLTREQLSEQWMKISPELANEIILPVINLPTYRLDFNGLFRLFPGGHLYYADVLFTLGFIFVGVGLTTVVYAIIYRMFGPPRNPYEVVRAPKPRRRR